MRAVRIDQATADHATFTRRLIIGIACLYVVGFGLVCGGFYIALHFIRKVW